jgi:hypothetical protein
LLELGTTQELEILREANVFATKLWISEVIIGF